MPNILLEEKFMEERPCRGKGVEPHKKEGIFQQGEKIMQKKITSAQKAH